MVHNNVYGNNYAGRGYGYGRNGYGYGYNGWNRGWGGWGGWGWGWPWYTAAWAWGYPYYGGYYPGYYAAYTYPDYGLYSTDVDVPVTQGTVDNSPPDSFASNSTAATESAETDPQWLGEAQEAFRQGDYRNAARLAAHAAIDSPQDPKAHEIASLALFAAGQFRGAAMEAHAAAGDGACVRLAHTLLVLRRSADLPAAVAGSGNVHRQESEFAGRAFPARLSRPDDGTSRCGPRPVRGWSAKKCPRTRSPSRCSKGRKDLKIRDQPRPASAACQVVRGIRDWGLEAEHGGEVAATAVISWLFRF